MRSLLADGGWPKGHKPTMLTTGETAPVNIPRLAATLEAALGSADIPIQVRIEPAERFSAALQAGDHEMALVEATVFGGDPHLFLFPLSTSEGAAKGSRALNYSFYRNPRLDDVLVRASQLSSRAERARLYQRAQALLAEDLPWLPIYVVSSGAPGPRCAWLDRFIAAGVSLDSSRRHALTLAGPVAAGPATQRSRASRWCCRSALRCDSAPGTASDARQATALARRRACCGRRASRGRRRSAVARARCVRSARGGIAVRSRSRTSSADLAARCGARRDRLAAAVALPMPGARRRAEIRAARRLRSSRSRRPDVVARG